ncbi:MAG: PEP-CTERM sorting domain-containing protein [Chroococcidiopsidaceae cyanobacterium CP_BM_RX_35]|nr:PEP-CTERM sorting domain-containing protein [Chroococcidiopsidaceae cyanobacterium CP_BM_RX_35]
MNAISKLTLAGFSAFFSLLATSFLSPAKAATLDNSSTNDPVSAQGFSYSYADTPRSFTFTLSGGPTSNVSDTIRIPSTSYPNPFWNLTVGVTTTFGTIAGQDTVAVNWTAFHARPTLSSSASSGLEILSRDRTPQNQSIASGSVTASDGRYNNDVYTELLQASVNPSIIHPTIARWTFTLNAVEVPEPSTIFGTLAFGAIGVCSLFKRTRMKFS